MKYRLSLFAVLSFGFSVAFAAPQGFFMGAGVGYGSSDWSYLVAHDKLSSVSVPDAAKDSGAVLNLFAMWGLSSHFGIKAGAEFFPTSKVHFAERSNYPIFHDKATWMKSSSQVYSVALDWMLPLKHKPYYLFSEVGASVTHRHDVLANKWRVGPLFGAGIGYDGKKSMSELGFTYTAGNAVADQTPAYDYVPFSYDLYFEYGYKLS
jgi:hypothetical protein